MSIKDVSGGSKAEERFVRGWERCCGIDPDYRFEPTVFRLPSIDTTRRQSLEVAVIPDLTQYIEIRPGCWESWVLADGSVWTDIPADFG